MNLDRMVQDLSLTQGGAVRLDQALGAGMTRAQIRYRVKTGRWSKLIRGSYLVRAMTTVDDHLRAAVAALLGAVVSHESAAEAHGLSYIERGLATVLVHSQTTHEFPGVLVRRCHDLSTEHVCTENDLPTTNISRTVVDLAGIVSKRNLAAIVDDAVTARLTTIEAIADVAWDVGRSGKPGTANLREVLDERSGPARRGTRLERFGNELLFTVGEAQPQFEYPVPWHPDKRFDAAYPDSQLAIEWDSRRWHTQASTRSSSRP